MDLPAEGSWVIGSSYQILQLTAEERRYLDTHPRVWCLNHFCSNWRLAGFRPTHFVFGDTRGYEAIKALKAELRAVSADDELLARLTAIHLTEGRPERFIHHGLEGRREWFVPFGDCARTAFPRLADRLHTYHRGPARRRDQSVAKAWGERIYHFASTITDAVNLAWLTHPGEPVRVLGNPFGVPYGHFYDTDRVDQHRFMIDIWAGLRYLRENGIDVRDANIAHAAGIPRELVWSASR